MRTSSGDKPLTRSSPRSLAAFLHEAHALRLRSQRSQGLFWTRRVSRPLGAIIAQALLGTRITPNAVSIAGMTVNLAGAALVFAAPAPAPVPLAIVVFVVWQFGYALDDTDGLLARASGQSSPFGAWLDQILDFVNHTAVVVALASFVARAFTLGAVQVSIYTALVLAGSLIGLFASAQRNALLGTEPALRPAAQARLRIPFLALHLTDSGLFLAIASAGLAWPPLLLVALTLWPALVMASVAIQVAMNWPRRRMSPAQSK